MIINEIFYSLQGEGVNFGKAAIFIRLSRCNLSCSFCDTEFDSGQEMSDEEIAHHIADYPARFIIWTGGEPTLQLRPTTIAYFKSLGYTQAIETNGTRPVPEGIDYITCSPKPEARGLLLRNFPSGVSEFRYPIATEDDLPPSIDSLPRAQAYLLSPIFAGDDAMQLDEHAVALCVDYIKAHPEWRLSLQLHKLISIP